MNDGPKSRYLTPTKFNMLRPPNESTCSVLFKPLVSLVIYGYLNEHRSLACFRIMIAIQLFKTIKII